MNKTTTIICSVIAASALVVAVIFFSQSRTAQNQTAELEKSLHQAEKDLIYYKNTDLGKEVELLNLKLENANRDLAAAQKDAAADKARVKSLEANLAKIPAYLAVIDAIQDLLDGGPDTQKLSVVDAKVNVLGDQQMLSRWNTSGRTTIDLSYRSWGNGLYEMVKAVTARVREIAR